MIKHTPNTSAITFPTTFLTYTTSTEAWKQSQRAKFEKNQLMAVVNSATVIFGAKLAVTDENLNVYKLVDSQNPFSALPI